MVGARRLTCTFMLAALFTPLFAAAPVAAQPWPTRSVKFILTLGPGSGADIGAAGLPQRDTHSHLLGCLARENDGGCSEGRNRLRPLSVSCHALLRSHRPRGFLHV